MVGLVVGLCALLSVVRVLIRLATVGSVPPSPSRPSPPPPSVSIAVLIWAIVPLKCLLWANALLAGEFWAAPWLAVGLVVLFPWAFTQRVLVPWGLWRSSYVVMHASTWAWRGDTRGGAVFASAWAMTRGRTAPRVASVAWLVARRDALSPLRGGGVLASAMLAELRDDRQGMLTLVDSVRLLADDPRHRTARGIAAQWLAAHAAAQGDWHEVLAVTQGVRGLPPGACLLRAIARRRVQGAVGAWATMRLLAAWISAPQRAASRTLVWATLRRPPPSRVDPSRPSPPPPAEQDSESDRDLEQDPEREPDPASSRSRAAVAAHAQLTATTPQRIRSDRLVALARTWEAALESTELQLRLSQRAAALGARRGDPLVTLRAEVTDELATLVRLYSARTRPDEADAWHDPPALLAAAIAKVQSTATAEVEACLEPIERRRHQPAATPAIDEWREFVALRAAYKRAVALRGHAVRRLLFDDVDTAVSNAAARLWNTRSERSIANAMFSWLLPEATAQQDDEAMTRLRRNVRFGL